MIAVLQRVSGALVEVEGRIVAQIGFGILVLVGIERADTEAKADRLLQRLLNYRLFEDCNGRMNLCLRDHGAHNAGLLLISQFTLAADTNSGNRPSFAPSAQPDEALKLYNHLVGQACLQWTSTQAGIFGANMQVRLTNSGPATFILRV